MPLYENSTIDELIDEYIHNVRHREVIRLKLVDGMTYEKIAEITGYSDRHVGTIIRRGIKYLSQVLQEET